MDKKNINQSNIKKYNINILKTKFPMKGNLPNKEPELLKEWIESNIYNKIRKKSKGKKIFILHDGPPYANGDIHIGHTVNKILKDIIIKYNNMDGLDTIYIPGWDCHGMPIEICIEKKFGKKISKKEIIKQSRIYANKQIKKQKKSFQRLGVFGDWDNSYKTMDFINEANEIRVLAKILKKGYIFQGLKPVYWCCKCKSTLAEAEIEYKKKTDLSIITIFPFYNIENIENIFNIKKLPKKNGGIIIWTTTPWTIPSNQALTVNPNIKYVLINTKNNILIMSEYYFYKYKKKYDQKAEIISTTYGFNLKNLSFKHPLSYIHKDYNRVSNIYLDKNVDIKKGTGIVHCSPAYGYDDFIICKKNGINDIDIIDPVLKNGKYKDSLGLFGGLYIWEANKKIINKLQYVNNILYTKKHTHKYMYCWRHKTPIIYKTTLQWFIGMDIKPNKEKYTLREIALKNIESIEFYPSYEKKRLYSMIKNRPDWTLSRQRQWGVPITFFIHKKTGEIHPKTIILLETIAKLIEKSGIEAWHNLDPKELIGNDSNEYKKSNDTLDVWFDSGTTHWNILHEYHKLNTKNFKIDLCIEGSDQHRGWFQSSILISSIIYKKIPHKTFITHGFVVDKNGHKMSKSLGNGIDPNIIINKLGADIIRLWTASINYSNELTISDKILKQITENYRKIRNTLRFLLANLSDFNFKKNICPLNKLLEIDKYAILLTNNLQNYILNTYKKYKYHLITSKIQNFCSEDLSKFYLDILKDRLYTTGLNSHPRRSAQTALYHITQGLLRIISPILSFTAEEAWKIFQKKSKTIHTKKYYEYPKIKKKKKILQKWDFIRNIKNKILKKIEKLRIIKKISSSLETEIIIYTSKINYEILNSIGKDLKFVFITSKTKLIEIKNSDKEKIRIKISKNKKCIRCWHYSKSVGKNTIHKTLCNRCITNLFENGEIRKMA